MKRLLLLASLAAGMTLPEHAAVGQDRGPLGLGLLRRRQQAKPDPATRARQLIAAVQSDPDEDKRKAAAEELRGLDPRTYPDIVPALVGAVQRDPSVAVRTQAVESLGRLKPVNQSAGLALEAALVSDPDAKVQTAIRSALWQYHLNGYRTVAGTPVTSQSAEPPLAGPRPATTTSARSTVTDGSAGPVQFRPIAMGPGKGSAYVPTPEPPLARPRPALIPTAPQPMPTTPAPATPPTIAPTPVVPAATQPLPTPAPTLPTPPPVVPEALPGIPVPVIPVAPVLPPPGSPPRNF